MHQFRGNGRFLKQTDFCLQRSLRHIHSWYKRTKDAPPSFNKLKPVSVDGKAQQDRSSDLRSLCEQGRLDSALNILSSMEQQGVAPSVYMYSCLLKACTKRKALAQAKQVHAHIVKQELESTRFLGESIVSTLAKCGGLEDALKVLHRLPHQTAFAWTAIISGYTIVGKAKDALQLYYSMRQEGLKPDKYTFATLVKACGSISDLEEGKRIHAEALEYGCGSDLYLGASLVDMYGKCGSILDAQRVFDGLLLRNVVSWNIILMAYTQQGQPEKTLQLYEEMQEEGVSPDDRTFVTTIQACGMLGEKEDVVGEKKSFKIGVAIHSEARRKGYDTDVFVGSTLISMYGKCGKIADAQRVFDGLFQKNVVSWNAMIAAYGQLGQPTKVLGLYEKMQGEGVGPDDRTFVSALQACALLAEEEKVAYGRSDKNKFLEKGKAIHADVRRSGCNMDAFVTSTLINMYGKCGSIVDAQGVFEESFEPSLVSWNAMLAAYTQSGQPDQALQLYEEMQQEGLSPNDRTCAIVLQTCCIIAEKEEGEDGGEIRYSKPKSLEKAKVLHAEIWRKDYDKDVYVCSTLINLYGKCGCIVDAKNVFDVMPDRDVVVWNAIVVAQVGHEEAEEGLQLYEQMLMEGLSPDDRTYTGVLQAYGMIAAKQVVPEGQSCKAKYVQKGKVIHADIWRTGYLCDVFVASTLISMYAKCGSIVDAENVFYGLYQHDVVSWNTMLAAYVEHGQTKKALQQYEQMQREGLSPDDQTFVSLMQACGMLADKEEYILLDGQSLKGKSLEWGKSLHASSWQKGYQEDVFIASTLIRMYGKCGSIVDAQIVFEALSQRSVVAWTAMLAAYVDQGQGDQVLHLYRKMDEEGVSPDEVTIVCILQACSTTGSLDICRQIHNSLLRNGEYLNLSVANTLLHAYGRCAGMADARAVFDTLSQPDVVSWTAMIAGYARQGDTSASVQCYKQMQVAGVKPNEVTFLSLLSACSHAGLVEKGAEYFESMSREHSLTPEAEHYVTMIDLLGRAGYFTHVKGLLSTMPMPPNLAMWLCLLSACQKHGNVAVARHAFDCALQLQPLNASTYMLMFNIYSDAGLWDHAKKVTELRKNAGAWKNLGQTWIEHSKQVHSFAVGNSNYQEQLQLFKLIGNVTLELRDEAEIDPRVA